MANNYTLMSMELTDVAASGVEFLQQQLSVLEYRDECPGWEYSIRPYKDMGDGVRAYNVPDADKFNVVIFSEESCNVDALAEVLRAYLKIFDPDHILYFTWASTCSKMRPDEFGGGAFVISDDSISWMNTWAWAEQQMNQWKEISARHGKSKTSGETEVPPSEPPTESSL